jgi:putative hydrolase of HD superfamily
MVGANSEEYKGYIDPKKREFAEDIVDLGKLTLIFSRVERMTYHEDGRRAETDSDHTVMLSIVACSIASELRPDLDVGMIAQYALLHDLVEVYAGDTPTIRITDEERVLKKQREAAALARIKLEFGNSFPWLIETMESYEALDTIEAKFVKAVDKLMPRITHLLNNGKLIKEIGMTRQEVINRFDEQKRQMSEYSADLPEVMELREVMSQIFLETNYPEITK